MEKLVNKGLGTIRISIAFKFILLIATLLVVTVSGMAWLSSHLFVEDNTALVRQFNANSADNLSSQIEGVLESALEGSRQLASSLAPSRPEAIAELFDTYKAILGVFVITPGATDSVTLADSVLSGEIQSPADSRGQTLFTELQAQATANGARFSLAQVFQDKTQARLVDLAGRGPMVALAFPWARANGAVIKGLVTLLRPARLSEPFGRTDGISAYLVDRAGYLVAHSDRAKVRENEDLSKLPIVSSLLSSGLPNQEMHYQDPESKEERIAAFRRVGFADLGVIAELPEAAAYEASTRVVRLSMIAALIFLGLAVGAGAVFAGALVRPINYLVDAAYRVSRGELRFKIADQGRDELGFLARAFNAMIDGLGERERLKETLHKFHDPQVAEKIVSGELKLAVGERRQAVILFCDIRGFTSMSEETEPEKVVVMLNEYLTRMVDVIQSRGGVIDKYVGDAILAVWGAPVSGTDDTHRAVLTCLEMRKELAKLNELRISRGEVPLRIGIGLHRGPVVAGTIGSSSRMEYTIIGDSVNLASRIEGLTKTFGTDLLISKDVYEVVKNHFVCTPCESTTVKGKSAPVELFRVQGVVDEKGQKVLVQTPYSSIDPRENPSERTGARLILPPVFRSPPPEAAWFVQYGRDVLGPFSTALVFQGIADGSFDREMAISLDRNGPWKRIAEVPELQKPPKKNQAA